MKRQWGMIACLAVLLAVAGSFAVAQDRGPDRNDQDRGNTDNRSQDQKQYRQFNDNQRQAAGQYYNQHHTQSVFQQKKWKSDYDSRLKPGYVLDPEMRKLTHSAPSALTTGLGPAPSGYRYVVIGSNLALVDSGYRVQDSIHLELNLGH